MFFSYLDKNLEKRQLDTIGFGKWKNYKFDEF